MGPSRRDNPRRRPEDLEVQLARLAVEPDSPRLVERLGALARAGAVAPHADLARTVLGLDLPEIEAERLLHRIEAHRLTLGPVLSRDPGFVWAALDHLCLHPVSPTGPGHAVVSAEPSAPVEVRVEPQLELELERELARIRRNGGCASLLAVTVREESEPADSTRERVGRSLRALLRESDVVTRAGDAELFAILPCADRLAASAAAMRVRRTLTGDAASIVSVGIGCAPQDATGPAAWARAARVALSRAGGQGGGRVVAHARERRGQLRLPAGARAPIAVRRADGTATVARLVDVAADGLALDGLVGVGEHEIVRVRIGSTPPHVATGRIVRRDSRSGRGAVALAERLPASVIDLLAGTVTRAVPSSEAGR